MTAGAGCSIIYARDPGKAHWCRVGFLVIYRQPTSQHAELLGQLSQSETDERANQNQHNCGKLVMVTLNLLHCMLMCKCSQSPQLDEGYLV